MKSLIIGMGIGELYLEVLTDLGHEVITVDNNRMAHYKSVGLALDDHPKFDAAFICTPNHTHEKLAYLVSEHSKIVFVEKPGLRTAHDWRIMVDSCPDTKFMMVKNNQYRDELVFFKALNNVSTNVNINWINYNRVPHPGGWFTNRHYSFGGVSRDLMPHLLSLYIALNPKWRTESVNGKGAQMMWNLEDIESTEYGVVNPNGTYDVDDKCHIDFGSKWGCQADWRSITTEDSCIQFIMQDNSIERFELGWCPEDAYESMIQDAVDHMDDYQFWLDQFDIDTWIHEQIETI